MHEERISCNVEVCDALCSWYQRLIRITRQMQCVVLCVCLHSDNHYFTLYTCSILHCVPVLFCLMYLAEDNSSNVLDHFLRLRRQWASKASYLRANLNKITAVDMTTIIGKAASWRVTSCVSTESSGY